MAVDWDSLVLAPTIAIFGEDTPAVYTPAAGGAAFPVRGVFDREYHEVVLLDDVSAANSRQPVLGVRLADFAIAPATNDRVYIASVATTFIVRNVQPDGHGWAKLLLNKAAVQ